MSEEGLALHRQSIVIDAVCPLATSDPKYLAWYREGGVTALAPTIGGTEGVRGTLDLLAKWLRFARDTSDLILVRRAADVVEAKESNRLGVYWHFQGTEPIEENIDLIDVYKALGVGIIQLTYNVRNRVGDGCEERTDAGLSRYGMRLVRRCNEAGVIVDCSHTGFRTSMDAIACSSAPVVLSHSNVARITASARNVADELLDAVAGSGGLIGVAGFPPMVANATRPTLEQFIQHMDAIVQRVGIDHVGLGIDYYDGQAGIASEESALRVYQEMRAAGLWSDAYPPPPHHYPLGIETPRILPNLTLGLLSRGYAREDVAKILGGNWLRVMRAVWG